MYAFCRSSWFYVLFFLILSVSLTAYAEDLKLKENTVYFLKLSNSLANGVAMTNEETAKSLEMAEQRITLLQVAIQKDPREAILYALPSKIVSHLPRTVQDKIERERTNIEGKLEIRAAIHVKAAEVIQYILETKDGTQYYLHFTDISKLNLKSDDILRINRAYEFPGQSGQTQLLIAEEDVVITKHALALPLSFGPQKTIVILTNFQDNPSNKPWTVDQVKNVVFASVHGMYNEASFKQTTVVGNVVGFYTIPLSSNSSCNTITNSVAQMASDAATKAGVDLSAYTRRIFMFPKVSSCGWAGLGSVGGSQTKAWLNGYNVAGITAHEMGHNIGLYHSHSLRCPGSPNTGSCSRVEYGDVADSMGAGTTAHFNAFQKERLGWLNYGSSPPIRTVTTTGTYMIDPFEAQNMNPKALKVLKKSGATSDFYYLEFRQPTGYDNVLNCSGCDYTKGVIVHQANPSAADSSDMLDMSPNDNSTRTVALLPGQTFKDPNAPSGGISITVNTASSAGASVNVSFGNGTPGCVRGAPTLTISPSTTQYVEAGENATWNITLRNNDNGDCGSSTYNLTLTSQNACIRYKFTPNALTLAPGTTGTTSLTVQTSNLLEPGIYPLTVRAVNPTQPTYYGEAIASLGISTPFKHKKK